jgi:hypothetical protein
VPHTESIAVDDDTRTVALGSDAGAVALHPAAQRAA